ncbi:MAG: DUF4148 domain-containing protein [Rhizobacter sp.]
MKKLTALFTAVMISAASVTAFAADNAAMMQKTRAEVIAELKAAIKTGDLIEPFTHKSYKELYPAKYPMSDSDAEMMAKEMMKNMPMTK